MGHQFAEIAFTESVREVQLELGSRANYSAMEQGTDYNHVLGSREANFIAQRDSFYMATVSETGWPYIQHRGGPAGFMRVIDERTIGFADFSGNRQYVSVGNLRGDDRVALFFMDYPNRTRLKLLGRVRLIGPDDSALLAKLEVAEYRANVERGFVIHVEAFDWNCPQHITPRFTESQLDDLIAPLRQENQALKARRATVVDRPEVLGDGPLELVISAMRQLTPRVRAYTLRDANGGPLPRVDPGSHLQIPVQLPSGETAIRHYSITNAGARDVYEIAILRDDEGAGGSRAVHEVFELGLRLRCALPGSYFPLHGDRRPVVLLAGGIGITPIKAMAQALRARGDTLHLHYAGRSHDEMAFADQLRRDLGNDLTTYQSADGKHMDVERIVSTAPADAIFYVCGPGSLIDAVTEATAALNIDPQRVRFERFSVHIDTDAKPLSVELRRAGKQLQVSADQSILSAMLDAGIDAPYSCRAGNCKSCAVEVLSGEPDHRDSALSRVEREEQRLMCPCVSRATGDHLVLDI